MCYASVNGQSSVSSGGFVDWLLTVVSVVLLILILTGCQSAKNITVNVCPLKGVSQSAGEDTPSNVTIGINNKTVNVPVNATVPLSTLGL